jgi:hypothetical protein
MILRLTRWFINGENSHVPYNGNVGAISHFQTHPHIIVHHHISSYLIIYHHMSSYIIIYQRMSSYIIIYHIVGSMSNYIPIMSHWSPTSNLRKREKTNKNNTSPMILRLGNTGESQKFAQSFRFLLALRLWSDQWIAWVGSLCCSILHKRIEARYPRAIENSLLWKMDHL